VRLLKYKWPETAIDAVIIDENETIVLIRRRNPPYQNQWALPGGFVELGEKVEDAVIREAKEETGLDIKILRLVGVYSDPNRDPRGHIISITYLCKRSDRTENPSGGDDAKEAKVFNRGDLEKIQLAFDHKIIIQDAFKLADQAKLW
jgi:8-oxo-dGTP diphosphatase